MPGWRFFLSFLVAKRNHAKDWWYGTALDAGAVGSQRLQYHHIHPQATLKDRYSKPEINDLNEPLDADTRNGLLYWFLIATIRGRYSGATDTVLSQDIAAARSAEPVRSLMDNLGLVRHQVTVTERDLAGRNRGKAPTSRLMTTARPIRRAGDRCARARTALPPLP
jgi:hypothetical protein